jgi:hypothetical protein
MDQFLLRGLLRVPKIRAHRPDPEHAISISCLTPPSQAQATPSRDRPMEHLHHIPQMLEEKAAMATLSWHIRLIDLEKTNL